MRGGDPEHIKPIIERAMKDKLVCPDCGADMILKDGKYGKFYGCERYPACEAAHGAHQETHKPLGIPADKKTRAMRIKAHKKFDKLWKKIPEKHRSNRRKWAYHWLSQQMGMTKEECHIGRFSIEQCQHVIEICEKVDPNDMLICTSKSADNPDRS
jgi:ssDNA-binding Zn-finger/Zn-ribbon topoisomerase 1